MSADGPTAGISPVEFSQAVVTRLISQGTIAEETMKLVCPVIERFGTFVQRGLHVTRMEAVEPEHAAAFIDSRQLNGSPATYGARRVRRMALRMAFETGRGLGLVRGDPTLDVDLGPPSCVSARALTDEEIRIGRSYAFSSLRDFRRSIAWAICEATGRTSEMGQLHVGDVFLEGARVWLPGSPVTDARWGHLTYWGRSQMVRRLSVAGDPDESLILWRKTPKTLRAACSQAVTETLKAAGLHGPDVRPRSILAWAGRKLYDEGAPIDEVARRLGMRSLDQTAEFIGMDWRGEEPA